MISKKNVTVITLAFGKRHNLRSDVAGARPQLYAGLSITGAVGTFIRSGVWTLQTNSWRCLEFLQLPASPYLWADKSAPATGQRFYRAMQTGAPTNMVFIPPGTFRMGSPTNEMGRYDWEGPQTAVTISRGFWMGKYEVTQGEYLAVMGNNPSYFTGDSNRPVESELAWGYCASSRSGSGWRGGLRPTACIGCQRRRSGSMRVGGGVRRGSVMEMTLATRT
jgi:formylglycine-generating enzyme required for sulfatase activity